MGICKTWLRQIQGALDLHLRFPLCLIEQTVTPHFRLWFIATPLLILPRPANISCPYSTAVLQTAMIFPMYDSVRLMV